MSVIFSRSFCVRRYFCKRLLGLFGNVYSIIPWLMSERITLLSCPDTAFCPRRTDISTLLNDLELKKSGNIPDFIAVTPGFVHDSMAAKRFFELTPDSCEFESYHKRIFCKLPASPSTLRCQSTVNTMAISPTAIIPLEGSGLISGTNS